MSINTIRIGTKNTRGFKGKFELLIALCKGLDEEVICLQEVYNPLDSQIKKLEMELNAKVFLRRGTNNSKGVITLIKNPDQYTVLNDLNIDSGGGRRLVIRVATETIEEFDILNVYAPTKPNERKEFINETARLVRGVSVGTLLAIGDWNCIIDGVLDRNKLETDGSNGDSVLQGRDELLNLLAQENLVDVYRHLCPNGQAYTYNGRNGYRSRLDKAYISKTFVDRITVAEVIPNKLSDHDGFTIQIGKACERIKWGKGQWKLNSTLLLDHEVKTKIEILWGRLKSEKRNFSDIGKWWDYAKNQVKNLLIGEGQKRAQNRRDEKYHLEFELQKLIQETGRRDEWSDEVKRVKSRLADIEKQEIEGIAVRSRADWAEQGEKSTKYFFDMEKERAKLKQISHIKLNDGTIVDSRDEVCQEVTDFYAQLYTEDPIVEDVADEIVNLISGRLDDDDHESMDGFITEQEALKMFQNMENNKAPGLDGLTKEFYIQMWQTIGQDLVEVYNNIYLSGHMPNSMTEGLVTLIYKEKGDIGQLKYWRPLSLMNVDYKGLTKVLAARVGPVMPKLVSDEQACGVPGRTIHDQLYLIQHLYEYHTETGRSGMLVALDQEKAFDRLNHKYMYKVLEKMNLSHQMLTWIKIIYSKMVSRININGFITSPIPITRSVRQGCPLSMLLFVLVSESLNQLVKSENGITPLKLPNTPSKRLVQYADDTTALLKNVESYRKIMQLLKRFEDASGAKINKSKTEILLLGRWLQREKEELPQNLIKDTVTILGIPFGIQNESSMWDKAMKAIDATIARWQKRNLSRSGKLLIIKSLLYSKIWHLAKVKGIPVDVAKKVERKAVEFLWHPRNYVPLKTNIIKNSKKAGGLGFPDVRITTQAYLLHRIAELAADPAKIWGGMLMYQLGPILQAVNVNLNLEHCTYANRTNSKSIAGQIKLSFQKVNDKVAVWDKETVKSLSNKLREN